MLRLSACYIHRDEIPQLTGLHVTRQHNVLLVSRDVHALDATQVKTIIPLVLNTCILHLGKHCLTKIG
jgi:hypothetical protein